MSIVAAESTLVDQELAYIILLAIAAAVAVAVRRIKLPYTVALVIVGLALSFAPKLIEIDISKDLILAVLVPPLLFEAALHLQWYKLRKNLFAILLFAMLGTLIGTFMVASVITQVLDINFTVAIAFGALISATDPVAVVAFFRTLGVDKRLTVLVEGESLFNDGVAIVIFNIALASAVMINDGVAATFEPLHALQEFAIVSGGGIAIGSIMGYVVATIILKNVDDHLIETAVTLTVAFGSFLLAENFGKIIGFDPNFHFSGILAVVAAALFVGNIGRINTSATTKVTLDNFWEFLAFVVNSLVFLIIGIKIDITLFADNIIPILVAVAAVLVSRALIVYTLSFVHSLLDRKHQIPVPYRHIMFWGGLRGAISLALVLTLTGDIVGVEVSEQLQVMTFGVVLFTLLVQGLTIEGLIKRLGLVKIFPHHDEQMRLQALVYAKRAGQYELQKLREQGILAPDLWDAMRVVYDIDIRSTRDDLAEHLRRYPELEQEMVLQARMDALRAERAAIRDAARRGLISAEIEAELFTNIDSRTEVLNVIEDNLGRS